MWEGSNEIETGECQPDETSWKRKSIPSTLNDDYHNQNFQRFLINDDKYNKGNLYKSIPVQESTEKAKKAVMKISSRMNLVPNDSLSPTFDDPYDGSHEIKRYQHQPPHVGGGSGESYSPTSKPVEM